jgi:hypothetical protein
VGAVPVTGTVTLDGQPVAGANVSFSPTSGGGKAAVGTTDASGKFTLTTMKSGDGAVPGAYLVTITKSATAQAPAFQDPRSSGGKLTPEQMQAMQEAMKGGTGKTQTSSEIPAKYANRDTSGFSATITKGEANDFTFEMTSN